MVPSISAEKINNNIITSKVVGKSILNFSSNIDGSKNKINERIHNKAFSIFP